MLCPAFEEAGPIVRALFPLSCVAQLSVASCAAADDTMTYSVAFVSLYSPQIHCSSLVSVGISGKVGIPGEVGTPG